eukprot:TRINITY_DN8543_c0_g1_i1.p1 TRINITY_DN8543_c0_g1~~TRINITY_DN8543_c0_g1_i1.p1  ORF type:complete len:667 (-),score=159.50 TRINITY_DN8543_c0_g1_i1:155-2155(-)
MQKETEKFEITPEESQRFEKAFRDPEFVKLFGEFFKEMEDPVKRAQHEEELRMLAEQQKAEDVSGPELIVPNQGFCVKVKTSSGQKVFINVCIHERVPRVVAEGRSVQIPYVLAPPHTETDHAQQQCVAYDFVVAPDTYERAKKSDAFRKVVIDTAVESVAAQYLEKIEAKDAFELENLRYKGQVRMTSMPKEMSTPGKKSMPSVAPSAQLTQPPKSSQSNVTSAPPKAKSAPPPAKIQQLTAPAGPPQPKYTIVHSGSFDLSHYTNARISTLPSRPRELQIRIELPKTRMADVELEVTERQLYLTSTAQTAWNLSLQLPFPVDDAQGSAKFNNQTETLTVVLPVLPPVALPAELPSEVPITTDAQDNEQEPDPQPAIPVAAAPTATSTTSVPSAAVTSISSTTSTTTSTATASAAVTAPAVPALSALQTRGTTPPYKMRQNDTTITVLINVSRIVVSSVGTTFQPRMLHVAFRAEETVYALHVPLFDGVDVKACRADVNDRNMVIVLGKEKPGLQWAALDRDPALDTSAALAASTTVASTTTVASATDAVEPQSSPVSASAAPPLTAAPPTPSQQKQQTPVIPTTAPAPTSMPTAPTVAPPAAPSAAVPSVAPSSTASHAKSAPEAGPADEQAPDERPIEKRLQTGVAMAVKGVLASNTSQFELE